MAIGEYLIKTGDTLSGIAKQFGSTVKDLAVENGISNVNKIMAGAKLKIPSLTGTDNSTGTDNAPTAVESKPFEYEDFNFSKQGEYDDLYKQYKDRKDFNYDFNADALYQQYKDKYIQQGKMAMADTMGQAAAMTGGYGNSYAATAGNQAYQNSLSNLNDIIPELYQMAYNKHKQEGQDMLNMMSLLGDERNFEYGEHSTKQGYEYQNQRDAIADEQWNKNYDLSARELEMAEEAWNLQKKGYTSSGSSGGSGGSGGSDGGDDPIVSKLNTLNTNDERDSYLQQLIAHGTIGEEEALSYLKNNLVPEQVALNKRTWTLKNDGGINWFGGVDNNAKLTDQYGNTYKASKLIDALVDSGISKKDAKKYVSDTLAKLGD